MEQGWIEGRRKEVVLDEETDYGSVGRDPKEYIVPDQLMSQWSLKSLGILIQINL